MREEIITYVYEDKEVYPTGRIASPNKHRKKPKTNKTLIEVVPVGTPIGDRNYSKWVDMEDLLIISNLEDVEIDEDDDDET